ncbi:methyl-accepting chemotaxis protein [Anaerovorax odorimutans]|uniref:methyl-accepting chemotaxis protein n=1 Tax=Anaerovorax odorimutans TaxID=109327 RepID=UPI0004115EBD|nr:methyl-accepting chemotaxis protein [Anaerovorax odorimutans]
MWKNMKIRNKILTGFAIIEILLIISMLFSMGNINRVSSEVDKYNKIIIPNSEAIDDIQKSMVSIQRYLYQAIATTDLTETKEYCDKSVEESNLISSNLEKLKSNNGILEDNYSELSEALSRGKDIRLKVIDSALKNDNETSLSILNNQFNPIFDEANSIMEKCYNEKVEVEKNMVENSEKVRKNALILQGILLIISVIISIIVSVIITKSINKPLDEIKWAATEVAKGNLNLEINYYSKDEIGDLAEEYRETCKTISKYIKCIDDAMFDMANGNFDIESPEKFIGDFESIEESITNFIIHISTVLGDIKVSAEMVDNASDQVSSGAQTLAQGATEQASSIEELSASISEISNQVKANAENSNKAKEMAINSSNAIENSNNQMKELMGAMDGINASSNEIGKIIKTIEDIAFQTNILALNAAVEAARAGTAGKGFAVVAEEVRNLASKSAEAAKNTTSLISSSIAAVDKGIKIANETAEALLNVVQGAEETTGLIEQVNNATNEQAASISQINLGIEQISTVIQNNSATSEESAAAAEELSGQAEIMKQAVNKFKVKDIDGVNLGKNADIKESFNI